MHKLEVAPRCPAQLRELAVEVAAILGFRSLSMDFPILAPAGGARPGPGGLAFRLGPAGSGDAAWSIRRSGPGVELALGAPAAAPALLRALLSRFSELEADASFAARGDEAEAGPAPARPAPRKPGVMESGYHPLPRARGLECLFEREYLVKDEDYDFLPDRIDASIILEPGFGDEELSAACDLAARLGMESLGLELPLLEIAGRPARVPGRGSSIRIEGSGQPALSLSEEEGRRVLCLRGPGPGLAAMASALCRAMPGTGDDSPLAELRDGLVEALGLRSLDGKLAWLESGGAPCGALLPCGPIPAARRAELAARFPSSRFVEARPLAVAAGGEIELPWELEACRALLERELYPRIRPGSEAEVLVVIGEGAAIRRELAAEIGEACAARGAAGARVRVLCAFKQGLSWLRDGELPELAALGKVGSVEISFSPFLPAGRASWNDEDGATPRIAPNRPDDPEAWLDPPIRLLQELYPADDLLAEALGIERDRITFTLAAPGGAPRGAPGYALVARDREGRVIRESAYAPALSERPYLDEFPGLGKVHPGAGCLRLTLGGETAWEGRFKTDLESAWEAYQGTILPAARALVEARLAAAAGAGGAPSAQSFFSRLVVELEASEPEEELGCRHDRLSSLESFHEDLYFAGLDYFQTLGIKLAGRGFDSPGLILPKLRAAAGRPRMRYAIMVDDPAGAAPSALAGGAGAVEAPCPGASAYVDELAYDARSGSFSPRLRLRAPGREAEAAAFAAAYARLLSEGLLEASRPASAFASLRIALEGAPGPAAEILARPPAPPAPPERVDIGGIEVSEDSLIGPAEFEAVAEGLGRVRGLRLRRVGESRLGRPIRAIELDPGLGGYVSRTKLAALRPTVYVNGRHHANEVSSTNSALMLAKRLVADPELAGLARRLNIVILPLENPDGAALHEELARGNPEWILHAARYDSLGCEFAREYFNDATLHPEARAFSRLWRDWLPDVVVDDHGVPSHEWCQPFSGYTSPWFKGFWMPRALLYGYFWFVTDEAYAANKAVAEGMLEAVAGAMGEGPEYRQLNAEWRDRFEKYAHAWMPKLFPAEYHRDVIFYWVPYAYKPDYYYVSVRFPWVTAASFVSEVADETAVGPYLGLCARAHLDEDLAVLELLAGAEPEIEEECWIEGQTLRARRRRRRPLKLEPRV
ncbi:MAG TPA: M14 family metallopeptidase [Spirochaetales bacterium]|nr:M14 family metallopeptidase [Spirochaetales bacterium]HRY54607.1 M14 family metallopeptidase [Spirochaetia bacterium]